MIAKEIREMVKQVIDLDITYLETFMGYKGDTVLKIVLEKKDVRDHIVRIAHKMSGLDFKANFEFDGKYKGQYSLFIAYEDPDIYQLKG